MSSVKKFNSNLIIQATNISSNVTIDAQTVNIPRNLLVAGNLSVSGTTTTVNSVNTNISDNVIVLNSGEVGAGVTLGTAGLQVDRGSLADAFIGWNESLQVWQVSSNVANLGSYGNILTTASALSDIVQDLTPQLGGNLDVNGFAITSSGYNTVLTGNLQLNNTLSIPAAQPNATVVYATTPNAGQSGVYVVNQTSTNEELVTKRRAFGFSLIL
jgi:hypothetical protein